MGIALHPRGRRAPRSSRGLRVDSIGLLFFQHVLRHIASAHAPNTLKQRRHPLSAQRGCYFFPASTVSTGLACACTPSTAHPSDTERNAKPALLVKPSRASAHLQLQQTVRPTRDPYQRMHTQQRRTVHAASQVGGSRSPDHLPSQCGRMLIPHRRQQKALRAHSSHFFVGMLVGSIGLYRLTI